VQNRHPFALIPGTTVVPAGHCIAPATDEQFDGGQVAGEVLVTCVTVEGDIVAFGQRETG